jgi:enediyne biosynthesis protein E7
VEAQNMTTQNFLFQSLKNNPITSLIAFQRDPYGFFDKHRPKGTTKPVALTLGFQRFFFCYDPLHAQHILQDQRQRYAKSSLVLKKIKALSGPLGLIQLNDQEAAMVRHASASLMNKDGMDRMVNKVNGFVEELFPLIDQAIANGKPVDLVPHLTRIVLRTAGVFVLNHDLISKSDRLNAAFVDLNRKAGESLRGLGLTPFSLAKRRSLAAIHEELDQLSTRSLAEGEEPSLLRTLTMTTQQQGTTFVRDQLKAFLFAGYDTTASSLIFATFLIASNELAQQSIAQEAARGPAVNYDSLKKATFVQSAYKEALRLYPSAYFLPRETIQDDTLGGIKIPKKSQVFLSVKHIQRHPDYFEQPDKFIPDRFEKKIKHPFSFIPFGGGPRICIGAALAKLEATLVLQKICERYEMNLVHPTPPVIEALITAHTKSPLLVRFKHRNIDIKFGRNVS